MNISRMHVRCAVFMCGLMVMFGGSSAYATELTSPAKTTLSTGSTLGASLTHSVMKNSLLTITCTHSSLAGKTTNSSGEYVNLGLTTFDFNNCGPWTVTVLKAGELNFRTELEKSVNGRVLSTGAEITVEGSGLHCVFSTNKHDLGILTSSASTGKTAMLELAGTLLRSGGRSGAFCGGTLTWTGAYTFNAPDYLDVD